MASTALLQFVPVFLLGGLAFVMAWVTVALTRIVGPKRNTPGKLSTYESGEVPIGSARGPIDVQYYIYVLVFLIIDIEAVFLIPWALQLAGSDVVPTLGWTTFLVEMVIFVALVLAGWAYAWRKGGLAWQA